MIITKTSFFTKLSIFIALLCGFQPSAQSMSSLSGPEGRGDWGAVLWGGCGMLAWYLLYQRFSTPLPDTELVVTLGPTDVSYERISQLIAQGYTKSALRLIDMADFQMLHQNHGSTNLFTQALILGHDQIALAILAKVPKLRDKSPDFLLKVMIFSYLPSDKYTGGEYKGKGLLYTAIRNSKTSSDVQRIRFLVQHDIAGCASEGSAEPYKDIEEALNHVCPIVPEGAGKEVELEQKNIRSEIELVLDQYSTRKP